jgi:hypothetical protein
LVPPVEPLRICRGNAPPGRHLGEPDNGVEWRAQLVAHAGKELRLVLAPQLQLTVLVLDLVEQPYVLDRDHHLIGERGETLEAIEASLRALERQRQRLLDRLKSESR